MDWPAETSPSEARLSCGPLIGRMALFQVAIQPIGTMHWCKVYPYSRAREEPPKRPRQREVERVA